MYINPIKKIVYYTPNIEPQAGLSEVLDQLSGQIKTKFGKDKIEVITNATCSKVKIVFKNGIVREFSMKYGWLLKHILENSLSWQDRDYEQWLSTLYA